MAGGSVHPGVALTKQGQAEEEGSGFSALPPTPGEVPVLGAVTGQEEGFTHLGAPVECPCPEVCPAVSPRLDRGQSHRELGRP